MHGKLGWTEQQEPGGSWHPVDPNSPLAQRVWGHHEGNLGHGNHTLHEKNPLKEKDATRVGYVTASAVNIPVGEVWPSLLPPEDNKWNRA